MQPYDESLVLQTNEKVKALYAEAGRLPDAQYPVWVARTVYDYCAGLSWSASESKHLRECRDALGLEPGPPIGEDLPPLSVRGQFFALPSGELFSAVQCSDFNLFARYQAGEDITPQLSQRSTAGFNMLRVWTLYNLQAAGIGTLLNPDYTLFAPFLRLCARYGLYVEFTAFTSTEYPNHWPALINAVSGCPNVLLELVNEGDLPVNQIDLSRYTKPLGILSSHGSGSSEHEPIAPFWDYATFHTNGSFEEQRKVGHNAMEIWGGPTLTNETSRYPDVGMWGGLSLDRQMQRAFDSAAGAALLCAGSCFHSVAGKSSVVWDTATEAVARSWAEGAASVPLACQPGAYTRRDDLLTPELLRVYQRGTSERCIVRIRK